MRVEKETELRFNQQLLQDKERAIKEKELLISELKKELAEIKINAPAKLEAERRKRQSENVHTILRPKQLELFKMLSQGEKSYAEMQKRISPFKGKVTIVKKTSENAFPLIPDNLDFVYIDGNHNYDFVKKDLEMYYSKIREGGIIGGHDFSASWEGKVRAILEFGEKTGLKMI